MNTCRPLLVAGPLLGALAGPLLLHCTAAPVQPDQPVVVTLRGACLASPPPTPRKVALAGPEEGCPPAFEACFTLEEARKLELNLRDAREWEASAWAACRRDAPGSPDAGTPDGGR
jgi:hypothetical protein